MSTTTYTKKSLTIRKDLDKEVRDRSGKRGYSEYVNRALENQVANDKLGEIVRAHEAEFGPVPQELLDEV